MQAYNELGVDFIVIVLHLTRSVHGVESGAGLVGAGIGKCGMRGNWR